METTRWCSRRGNQSLLLLGLVVLNNSAPNISLHTRLYSSRLYSLLLGWLALKLINNYPMNSGILCRGVGFTQDDSISRWLSSTGSCSRPRLPGGRRDLSDAVDCCSSNSCSDAVFFIFPQCCRNVLVLAIILRSVLFLAAMLLRAFWFLVWCCWTPWRSLCWFLSLTVPGACRNPRAADWLVGDDAAHIPWSCAVCRLLCRWQGCVHSSGTATTTPLRLCTPRGHPTHTPPTDTPFFTRLSDCKQPLSASL